MKNKNLKKFIFTAVFASLICVATMTLHIPLNFGSGGYIHLGDTFIFLAATLIGFPYAFAAASIGASLADLFSGYAIYVIPTFIIKSLMIIFFTAKSAKIINLRNLLACAFAIFVTIAGYYITALILFDPAAALGSIFDNIIQSFSSVLIFLITSVAIEKTKLKEKIFNL